MRRVVRPGESHTAVIARAVADETRRSPEDLEPFGDSIDTEAVENLFTRSSEDGPQVLTILYEGCRVKVEDDAVTVEEVPGPA